MRVRSYLISVGLACTLGGLAVSTALFQRQLTLEYLHTEAAESQRTVGDFQRISDQIRQLFVTTDLLFGAGETYVLQGGKAQVKAALKMCESVYKQLTPSQDRQRKLFGEIHVRLALFDEMISAVADRSAQAEFFVSTAELDKIDDASYELVEFLGALKTELVADSEIALAKHQQMKAEIGRLIWVLCISYVLLVVGVLVLASKYVSLPLSKLSKSAEAALADNSAFQPVVGGPREVLDLSRHIGAFVASLQDRVTAAEDLSAELNHQASHDALTGLANRRNLEHVLKRADNGAYALCMIDLDQFKLVNDTSGHQAGDALLIQVGHILRSEVRDDDAVVRMGGDEFALLLRDCPDATARAIAERIRQRVEELVFRWEDSTHRIGCSIGLVCTTGGALDITEVMKQADIACYAAKEAGRNRVVVHDTKAENSIRRSGVSETIQLVNHALENDDFVLYSQPILALKEKGHVLGDRNEVLIRLRDRASEMLIAPGGFMPSVERYGLSAKIDRWVVSTVLRAASTYALLFKDNRSFWVNLSGASLNDESFTEYLFAAIEDTRIPAGTINFEITETAVVRNLDQARDFIVRLRSLGCRFALDDFGSGLSSFGYLKNLPVDVLKLDGMFVKDIVDDVIDRKFVQSIIEIAHTMDIQTVVECVETEEILRVCVQLGADFAQGYGIAKPQTLMPKGGILPQAQKAAAATEEATALDS